MVQYLTNCRDCHKEREISWRRVREPVLFSTVQRKGSGFTLIDPGGHVSLPNPSSKRLLGGVVRSVVAPGSVNKRLRWEILVNGQY